MTTGSHPRITVAMSVFNGVEFLQDAIDSVLDQTEEDFEFLIVDDASTDGASDLLVRQEDPRIRVIRNENNQGLAAGLNRILAEAHGDFIARMDGDDLSVPYRFELQARFLETHPDIAAVGSAFTIYDSTAKRDICIKRRPEHPQELHNLLGIAVQICHPSSMYRREAAIRIGGYRPKTGIAEDFDFWLRMREHFRLANLSDVLHRLRWHDQRVSNARLMQQVAYSKLCLMLDYERRLLGEDSLDCLTDEEISLMFFGQVPHPRKGASKLQKTIRKNWERVNYWHDPRYPERGLLRRLARWPGDLEAWRILSTLIKVRVRWKMRPVTFRSPSGELLKA